MIRTSILTRIATCIAALILGPATAVAGPAEWALDSENSTVSFVSLKNVDVAEAHRFASISGGISGMGRLNLEIALDSVDTRIPIRDERMREHLFTTQEFPTAEISGQLDWQTYADLEPGQSLDTEVRIELNFRGATTPFLATVQVSALNGQVIQAVSSAPILVSARSLGVADGVEKLREIAGLQSISMAVPVYFSLRFRQASHRH